MGKTTEHLRCPCYVQAPRPASRGERPRRGIAAERSMTWRTAASIGERRGASTAVILAARCQGSEFDYRSGLWGPSLGVAVSNNHGTRARC